ncbi:MAG TPA: N-acetyl-gamma-glutamyl-phosphate reductase [Kiritimatiellia bacterium]|nr:N-acetyl-gamma-glutamyl-phosphate reductase [Kiritimatiellia bacterium]HMO98599.1 N-acetyl-gamma-glutamyl-phosphate reductase [Kiritimatiellia bacterium]HMP95422.1 N-acetyl-gamma-glutamyl-phosphate reductase [Kiritimatiellia bacterium]
MITVKIIGAGGYGGVGITELLLGHPEAKIQTLVAATETGMKMSELYPHLDGFCDLPILKPDDSAAQEPADVVFFSTPDGVGMVQARAELEKGAKVIDYSGDFRFESVEDYAEYARRIGKDPNHKAPDLLPKTVYGVAEIQRDKITPERSLVGNPGCFAVGVIIGLAPAAKNHLVEDNSIICDCKSAVSGAGKKPAPGFHYPARYDNMNAYRLTGHQHVVEVEQALTRLAGKSMAITFTTQVVPACRGILSCLYGQLRDGVSYEQVLDAYRTYHAGNRFVRVYDRSASIGTANVRGSNYCNLIVDVDERTRKLRVISHIDNLMKGQAGSALQNMNLIMGFPEHLGLDRPGQYP